MELKERPSTVDLNGEVYHITDVESVEGDGDDNTLSAFYASKIWYVTTSDGILHDVEVDDLDYRTEHLLSEFVQTM